MAPDFGMASYLGMAPGGRMALGDRTTPDFGMAPSNGVALVGIGSGGKGGDSSSLSGDG